MTEKSNRTRQKNKRGLWGGKDGAFTSRPMTLNLRRFTVAAAFGSLLSHWAWTIKYLSFLLPSRSHAVCSPAGGKKWRIRQKILNENVKNKNHEQNQALITLWFYIIWSQKTVRWYVSDSEHMWKCMAIVVECSPRDSLGQSECRTKVRGAFSVTRLLFR